ncbi:MAG: TetR/AcrR family transcriptional regulator [Frankiales bacterium]|nr:TetR/AcrR family transcriptional regulator [Frankiales bacterium]
MTSQRHINTASDGASVSGATSAVDRAIPANVLEATRATVLAVGVRRTTLTDVARRAGVSRMTLYRLVPDVTTLILEVMTREFAALLHECERSSARRRTARARIVATAVSIARTLPGEPLFRRVLDVDPEILLPYITERIGSTQRLAAGHVRRMLADGVADGSVRRGDLDVMATALVLLVTPYVLSARLLDEVGYDAALGELERIVDGWLRP